MAQPELIETALSDVNGAAGRLVIAGQRVEDLAARASFEFAAELLAGRGPAGPGLAEGRALAFERLGRLGDALERDDVMSALIAALAHVPFGDGRDALATATRASGALATFTAAWWRLRHGLAPIAPALDAGHAADFLHMLRGEPAHPAEARALDAYLSTVCEHGMNASTYAARVVASTHSDAGSALVAALGALKGPLHGGAPGPVLEMLDRIGNAAAARSLLASELAAGRRIMGMGHRIYRVRDPRAEVLERAARELEAAGVRPGITERIALARAVESAAEELLAERHPERALRANVEFYTAVLLDALGLSPALFSAVFAIARSAGWSAHVAEQLARGRLIRPESRYVGPMASEPQRT